MAPPRLKLETGAREEDERDDRPTGGLFHRTRHLRGWSKHLHGYACPRCGPTCHDRGSRDLHDKWHRDDDQAWQEWTEELEQAQLRILKLEGQLELMTELLGPALAGLMEDREPA